MGFGVWGGGEGGGQRQVRVTGQKSAFLGPLHPDRPHAEASDQVLPGCLVSQRRMRDAKAWPSCESWLKAGWGAATAAHRSRMPSVMNLMAVLSPTRLS